MKRKQQERILEAAEELRVVVEAVRVHDAALQDAIRGRDEAHTRVRNAEVRANEARNLIRQKEIALYDAAVGANP